MYQTIPTLFKQWSISVDIMPIGIVTVWSNILLVGKGGYIAEYGDTTPGIYFWPNSTEIVIASAINGIKDNIEITDPKPINEWIRVEISQLRQSEGVYEFTIRIAELIVRQINNTDAREFLDVKVYTGDDFYPAANAKIANLTIDTFPDNIYIVTKNHLYETLPILFKQWTFNLLVMPIGIVNDEWSSLLHVGLGGNNAEYGDRTPAIFMVPSTTKMEISSAIDGNKDSSIETDPLPINKWTQIEISQLRQTDGVYQFTIRIGELILRQMNNTDAREFSDVMVFTGNNFYQAAHAKIANFTFDTFPDNLNIVPTQIILNDDVLVDNDELTISTDCVSSEQMRYWENVDLPRNGISYTKVSTVESCMDLCLTNKACNAFTYDTINRLGDLNCLLKTEPSTYNTNSDSEGFISGVRCSAASIEEPLSQPDHYPKGLYEMTRFLFKYISG